ncbi:MAG: prepilin-type N-terminal cleavage/methylation domain-containing protein [Bacilli bacterium]|nr:prepilin-type N-terminal cleavage/methylation domain-containing protein [Bacilli bacterium]
MNRKGFTLVEILGTITILGIISSIAIISITRILYNAKVEYYKSLESTVESAARDYYNDHRILLPENTSDSKTVTVDVLINNKYLTSFKDHKKNKCDAVNSKVTVKRVSLDNYKYDVDLKCTDIDKYLK